MLAAIYFWSGLQKLNPNFYAETYPWLMEPVAVYMGAGRVAHLKWLADAFPILEMLTGILLFTKRFHKHAVMMVFIMHLFILFSLGPVGHNYNMVVWPWNIAMVAFAYILFFKTEPFQMSQLREMLQYPSFKIVTLLTVLMPLFCCFNLWDSYLSNNLYSGNTSNAVLYISDSVETQLPEKIKPYSVGEIHKKQIVIKYWCMTELGVPPYPEKRNFETVAKTFYKYAHDSSEIQLIFLPKLKLITK